MKKLLIPIVCVAAILVTGCDGLFPAYKLDIQQGNLVEQKDLNKVKLGMTKRQVRYLLGTPLINDSFHRDRWDYVYSYSEAGNEPALTRLSFFFDDDRLTRIAGDMQPQESADAEASETRVISVEDGTK